VIEVKLADLIFLKALKNNMSAVAHPHTPPTLDVRLAKYQQERKVGLTYVVLTQSGISLSCVCITMTITLMKVVSPMA
jgi:hypothetical protein